MILFGIFLTKPSGRHRIIFSRTTFKLTEVEKWKLQVFPT